MPLPRPSLNTLLVLSIGLLLGVIGYLIGSREDIRAEGRLSARQFHVTLNAHLTPDSLDEGNIHWDSTPGNEALVHKHSMQLAMFVADHSARMMEGDPLHLMAIQRLREPWTRWIGICSQMGDYNSGGGTGWPRMYRGAPFAFEAVVHRHLNLLCKVPLEGEELGPSQKKVDAMLKALSLQRKDYDESQRDKGVRASVWELRREQLHDAGAIWANEIAPYLRLLPTPVADDLIGVSLESLNCTLHSNNVR
jgi:hypothetical protein